ncbi:hypothetical protein PPH41_40810, partial [Burkholderia gladioli]|nr:hypothetical protein [Burkholderia gladioli]
MVGQLQRLRRHPEHAAEDAAQPLRDGELRLWLLRPEWQLLSKEDAFARLSPFERKRAKCFPQPAIGKRFAVGRAVLRGILG